MLEERIRRIRVGKRMVNDMYYNYLHPKNMRYSPEIHDTRTDGLNEYTDN